MAKILLEANHIRKAYGDRVLLDIEQMRIYSGERIGLIGENGMGKSTLTDILFGDRKPDSGQVRLFVQAAYIRQTGSTREEITPMERSRYLVQPERDTLSGGEMTRRRIAAAMSREAELLIADEPTTDLDMQGTELLTKQLAAYPGSLLLISHDRALLEKVCNRIWYLKDGKVTVFAGGYAAFREEQKRQRDFQQFEYDQYRAEQDRLRKSAQRLQEMTQQVRKAPSRMGNSEARLHKREATDAVLRLSHAKQTMTARMARMEKKERPASDPRISMALGDNNPIPAKNAVSARNVTIRAGGRLLIENASFTVRTGMRTALIGMNGCGKSTLLRMIGAREGLNRDICLDGEITVHPGADIGLFDQDHALMLKNECSILDNVMRTAVTDEATARTVLARLDIRGDAVFKRTGVLSGGEKAKCALAKLLVSGANLLILDEPTNHLDVFTMEALEDVLEDYHGTLLFVSHDRTFLRHIAQRLLLIRDRQITFYEGTLDEYEKQSGRDHSREQTALSITALEMRLAALSARLSAPQKGDNPLKLNGEYLALADELRKLKRNAES